MSHRNPFQTSVSNPSTQQNPPTSSVPAHDPTVAPKQPTGATLKNLSEEKLISFAIGTQKKSRFQKAREEQEAKRKADEEEAAKVYQSFVQSFQEDDDDEDGGGAGGGRGKTFVRGGKMNPDTNQTFGGKSGEIYRLSNKEGTNSRPPLPSTAPPSSSSSSSSQRQFSSKPFPNSSENSNDESKGFSAGKPPSFSASHPPPQTTSNHHPHHHHHQQQQQQQQNQNQNQKKPKREMDSLLEELKGKYEGSGGEGSSNNALFGALSEEEINFYGLDKGSFDTGDPTTTNLYVGNLNPTTTEEELTYLFGKFGEINSVKVMWPRTEEERLKKRNCGFVSFKDRRDAAEAMFELNETFYKDYKMVICWGKAVKIRNVPFIPPKPPAGIALAASTTNSTGLSSGKVGRTESPPGGRKHYVDPPSSSSVAPPPPLSFPPEVEMTATHPQTIIRFPQDPVKHQIIDLLASFVAVDGDALEKIVKAREEKNPYFDFLYNLESDDAQYYRWRTYANIVGETDRSWREKPFQYSRDGTFIIPPPAPVKTLHPPSSAPGSGLVTVELPSHSARRDRSPDRFSNTPSRIRADSVASQHSPPSNHRKRSPSPSSATGDDRRRGYKKERSPSRSSDGSRSDRSRSHSRSHSRSRSPSVDRDGRRRRRDRSRSRSRSRDNHHRASNPSGGKYGGMTGAQIERAREKHRQSKYSSLHRRDLQQFLDLLRSLDLSKQTIKQTMGFAFDKIESAEEMISLIKNKLILPSSYAAVKIAGVYLLSDILHNSATPIPGATNFRILIQNHLPEIFQDLGKLFRNTVGRMSAHNIDDRIKKVLAAWKDWSIFPFTYLAGLESMFYMTEAEYQEAQMTIQKAIEDNREEDNLNDEEWEQLRKRAKLYGIYFHEDMRVGEIKARIGFVERYLQKKYGIQDVSNTTYLGFATTMMEEEEQLPVTETVHEGIDEGVVASKTVQEKEEGDVDGVPLDDVDGVPLDDVDGVPIEDVDGVPLDDIDGKPLNENVEDLDGMPMDQEEEEEDLDGAPLESEDIDGAPIAPRDDI